MLFWGLGFAGPWGVSLHALVGSGADSQAFRRVSLQVCWGAGYRHEWDAKRPSRTLTSILVAQARPRSQAKLVI